MFGVIYQFVCVSNVCKRDTLGNLKSRPARLQSLVQGLRGSNLSCYWEVIAAQKVHANVLENMDQNGMLPAGSFVA